MAQPLFNLMLRLDRDGRHALADEQVVQTNALLAALALTALTAGVWLAGVVGMGVAAIYAAGQVIEGNFLTPKLVGSRVGLHPVWVIFGLLAGGVLFGFVGVLLAVPATAVVGVLVRHGLAEYLSSHFYLDPSRDNEDTAGPSS